MKRVAPDVERLMWLVAEQRDPKAISDFEARFPDLKAELAKHLAMVNGLKKAARKAPPHQIPRFTPKHVAPRPMLTRPLAFAAAIVLAAVAFGTYSVTTYLQSSASKPPPVANVVPDTHDIMPSPIGPKSSSPPNRAAPTPDSNQVAPNSSPVLDPNDPLQAPVTLKVDRAPLIAAIAMICKAAKLSVDIGPGLSTKEVSLDYDGTPALEALQELGQRDGFTPLPDERGKILIIPVRPDGSPIIHDQDAGAGTPGDAPLQKAVDPNGR